MGYSKSEAVTLIREYIDDPDAQRWGADALELHASVVLDELWSEILDIAPYFLSKLETVSLTSPGYIDLDALSERYYRVQSITKESQEYSPASPQDVVIEDNEVVAAPTRDFKYFRAGRRIYLLPLDTDDAEFRYGYRPARFDSLADADDVVWPDGHDAAYLHMIAGRALMKGDAEDPSTHIGIGTNAMRRLKAAVARDHPGPQTIRATSTSRSWGGVD